MDNLQNISSEFKPENPSSFSPQIALFPCQGKSVEATFSAERISSDGGVLLLREVENQIGLLKEIAGVINDDRDPRYINHQLETILKQRVFQIACGYEDGNDCDVLKSDPAFKLSVNQLPQSGDDLASQPTMSRFENSLNNGDLYRIAQIFVQHFISSYSSEPTVIILDCDDTNNNVHGGQQLALFNHYYREHCYMPLHIYEGLSGKLITTILKPGRRAKGVDIFAILKRLICLIRRHWKKTKIIVRGDGHFTSHNLMDWALGQENIHFLTGLTGNKTLKANVAGHLQQARELFERKGKKVKLYHCFSYKAKSWQFPQRVIAKIEYGQKGENLRFVVTDLHQYRTRQLYEIGYCARGRMELMIKDNKTYLKSDRSSCSRFQANQLRLFLHSAAYVLLHTLQKEVLKGTEFASSTMQTLQLKVIKVAARIKELKTKIKIELPEWTPSRPVLTKCFELFSTLRC